MNELERLAEAASPGPWLTVDMTGNGFETVVTCDDDPVCHAHVDDAAFIAAANPAVVLELLEQVNEVVAALSEMARLKAQARIMGAVSPDGHIARGIERHTLSRIARAVGVEK